MGLQRLQGRFGAAYLWRSMLRAAVRIPCVLLAAHSARCCVLLCTLLTRRAAAAAAVCLSGLHMARMLWTMLQRPAAWGSIRWSSSPR